jgi:hypothetical protein
VNHVTTNVWDGLCHCHFDDQEGILQNHKSPDFPHYWCRRNALLAGAGGCHRGLFSKLTKVGSTAIIQLKHVYEFSGEDKQTDVDDHRNLAQTGQNGLPDSDVVVRVDVGSLAHLHELEAVHARLEQKGEQCNRYDEWKRTAEYQHLSKLEKDFHLIVLYVRRRSHQYVDLSRIHVFFLFGFLRHQIGQANSTTFIKVAVTKIDISWTDSSMKQLPPVHSLLSFKKAIQKNEI